MSIQAIISQPLGDSIYAAYRPVSLTVTATDNTAGGGPVPPVVYCDIYFNDVFYKTLSKTQYSATGGSNSNWTFDIQDAAQEYLRKFITAIGDANIIEATTLVCKTLCKFRCSGYDTNGFITPDGTAPIQATSSSAAVAGTGTESNVFYIVNATLQHQDSQDLATHLTGFKTRTWTADAVPLTHRPDGYSVLPDDSDTFPVLMISPGIPRTLQLNYRYCNQSTFTQSSLNVGPPPMCTAVISDPIAVHNISGWLVSWSLVSGSPGKYFVSTPTLNGGAPYETTDLFFQLAELAEGTHTITVRPLCLISGTYYPGTPKTVNVTVGACVGAGLVGGGGMPDAVAGTHYHVEVALSGTAPFSITSFTTGGIGWLSASIVGSFLVFDGDPVLLDVGTDLDVDVTVENACGSVDFHDTIDVTETEVGGGGVFFAGNSAPGISINNITPAFYTISSGSFPIPNGSGVSGSPNNFTGVVGVSITKVGPTAYLRLYIDSVLIECLTVSGSGFYPFASHVYTTTSNVQILVGTSPC
jgi:hypothetical protein